MGILEIFTKRATTSEAQLQIKLAKLQYDLARAKEKVRLATKGEQPGFMGLGAYEVDIYYESVKKEVHTIRKKLKKVREKRVLHRERRIELGFSAVSLAGYTHAGKSTLFNALTEEHVPVNNTLFTTLTTTTRLIEIEERKFLLTDTVGFIDRLPTTLMEAFRSTLEETIYSDLILLVVDASEQLDIAEKKLSICLETIEHIGASGIPIITVLNKTDLMSEAEIEQKINQLKGKTPNPVAVSAVQRTNLDKLESEILEILKGYVQSKLIIPLSDKAMPFVSWLFRNTNVKSIDYAENCAHIVFESKPEIAEKVRRKVEDFKGKFEKTMA